ncbi:MAG: sugar transferase [Ilumatobacteraceae bacterium]|nr:sugar transferase [Ilumatobacteraceae bacterium]
MAMEEQAALADPIAAPRSFLERNRLKISLIGGDAASLLLGSTVALVVTGYTADHNVLRALGLVGAVLVAGLWSIRSQGLLLSRVSTVRIVETTRIARSVALLAALTLLIDRIAHFDVQLRQLVVVTALTFVALMSSRALYRSWLSTARKQGRFCRRIVLVGTDDESARMLDLLNTHTELGYVIAGVIGVRQEAVQRGLGSLWLGDLAHAEALISFVGISGAVVSASGIPPARLNDLIRNLHATGVHLHVATGVAGIDSRRLLSMPLAYESLLYVEGPSLSKLQLTMKRILDVAVAALALLLLSPLLALVALAIKLGDRGPVFFKQRRVGRDGREFEVVKFRSMAVDAEQQLAKLKSANQRIGPLFKMDHDPRVTRIGRIIRETGIDELPQLLNVLRGEMSLVGPRPALPAEVATFPPSLRAREQVLPGITGLWQVEARDKPSFEAYRRLDLFYVENWSSTLDMMIILNTIEQFCGKLFGALRRQRPGEVPAPVSSVDFPTGRQLSVVPPLNDGESVYPNLVG